VSCSCRGQYGGNQKSNSLPREGVFEKTERGKHPKHRPAKNAGTHGLAHLEKGNLVHELGVVVHGRCCHARLRWWRSSGAPARIRNQVGRRSDDATARGRADARARERGQCVRRAAAPSAAHTDRQQRHGGQYANARVNDLHPHRQPHK
jgi:hypothetical protein